MNKEHVLSDELFMLAAAELVNGRHWISFNERSYFLDRGDMYFFKERIAANEFVLTATNELSAYRIIYARSMDELLKQIIYGKNLDNLLSNKIYLPMNEKNYDYLANQIKYTGFGEDLQGQLKEKLNLQEPNFTLAHQKKFGKDEVTASLYFKKSDESDMYFFNRYLVAIKNERFPDPLKQTFYINPKEESITLKEAYNLMNGRAVHKELANKEGEKYKAWLQLDLKETDANGNHKMKQFHQNYGYDMGAVLASYPIKELQSSEEKQRLTESLERGNRQSVTINVDGKESKMFIEASPQFKGMNLYDANMKRISKMTLTEEQNKDSRQQQVNKQTQKEGEEGSETTQKKSKRKSRKIG